MDATYLAYDDKPRQWMANGNNRPLALRQSSVLISVFVCLAGCGQPSGKQVTSDGAQQEGKNQLQGTAASASCLLVPADYGKFRPGRSKTELLDDLQWRGCFEQATSYKGKNVAIISYGLFGGPSSDHGTSALAVFIDDKFEKLVQWPVGDSNTKIGDFNILIRAVESDPVRISDLEKEMHSAPAAPHQSDAFLTAAWAMERKSIEAARARGLKANAKLRDQFNAARLEIGMKRSEVQAILKANPIDAGETDAGSFEIYGSSEALDITEDQHYSNILILLEVDDVTGIYSGAFMPGGLSIDELLRFFADAPARRQE